ncbi:MAG: hypothetical protein AAB903_00880 [Patescibacteria group bacterium]
MNEDFDRSPYTKKAFELAYAMLRISHSIKSEIISNRLEHFAHKLLEVFSGGRYEEGASLIEESAWFIRLWTDLAVIHRHLGESLLLELSKLKGLALEASTAATLPRSVEDLFPSSFSSPSQPQPEKRKERVVHLPPRRLEERSASSSVKQSSFHYDSSNRQSAIIEFVKEKSVSGNGDGVCRMKEIQDKFPFVSERTLRYDLQKMIEQRILERVGGGPMSAYRWVVSLPEPSVTSDPATRYNS